MGSSNLYSERAGAAARRAHRRLQPRRQGLPLQLRHRGERVRDQAGAKARARARYRAARDRRPRRRLSRPHAGGAGGDAEARARGPLRPAAAGLRSGRRATIRKRLQRPRGRAPPPCWSSRSRARRASSRSQTTSSSRPARPATRTGALLVFDEVQCGMGRTGLALGLRAAAGATRRADGGEGTRRRAAGGRVRDGRPSWGTCSSAATTARLSPALRSWRRRRSPRWT